VLTQLWQGIGVLFSNLFSRPDWRDVIDIAITAFIIYQGIKLFKQTRANSVIKGLAVVMLVTWLSELLQLSAINWLLRQVINMGVLVLVVLFQPELRRGLEKIGRSKLMSNLMPGVKSGLSDENVISELVRALTNMAKKRIGALIVFERNTGLKDIIDSGTMVDAQISAPLIENIFEPNTPLHDGAMIIRGSRIVAAACLLQLSDNRAISRELGTRHRAAIGISETTDAITLIVSEETGIISMAREGKLTRYLDAKSLTTLLKEFYGVGEGTHKGGLLKRREVPNEK
jgi:diadenylate cyclase